MPAKSSFLDWKLIFTREVMGAVVALLTTALLVMLCYDGMRISGVWAGL